MSDCEIVGFICKECGKNLAVGTCGKHRIETGHQEFAELRGSE